MKFRFLWNSEMQRSTSMHGTGPDARVALSLSGVIFAVYFSFQWALLWLFATAISPLKLVHRGLWEKLVFLLYDATGAVFMVHIRYIRRLQCHIRADETSMGSSLAIEFSAPFISIGSHQHAHDIVLHSQIETVIPVRLKDGTRTVTYGRIGSCSWRGLKATPFGWMLSSAPGNAFVGYGKEQDMKILRRVFSSPFLLGIQISPEGAVYSEERHEEALAFAEAKGLPKLNHLLLPRSGALTAAMEAQAPKIPAIYDWTIGYKGGQQEHRIDWITSFVDLVSWRTRQETLHFHVRRLVAPDSLDNLQTWLNDRWIEKDELLGQFLDLGEFPGYDVEIAWPQSIWAYFVFGITIYTILPLVMCAKLLW